MKVRYLVGGLEHGWIMTFHTLNAAFQGRGEKPSVLETKLDVSQNGPVNGEKHDELIVFFQEWV